VAIIDDLKALNPVANNQLANNQPSVQNSSWVKDLIDKRYQPKTERLKRSPVGFDFTREPFDPSSYYKSLGLYRDISRGATNVSQQVANNREAAQQQRDFAANQAAIRNSTGGINPNFTYGNFNYSGGSRKYGLKGVSPNVGRAADSLGSKFGIRTIGGRGPGSVPNSDHPKGLALDYMINNLGKRGHATGNALANYAIQNYKAWNIKYVIWNRYIWSPGRGWHRYNGPSPHTDHVHVSFNR
jgi:hypothetical protein